MHASNDVLVVGAGPVGLTAAGELASAGVSPPPFRRRRQSGRRGTAPMRWSRTHPRATKFGMVAFNAGGHGRSPAQVLRQNLDQAALLTARASA